MLLNFQTLLDIEAWREKNERFPTQIIAKSNRWMRKPKPKVVMIYDVARRMNINCSWCVSVYVLLTVVGCCCGINREAYTFRLAFCHAEPPSRRELVWKFLRDLNCAGLVSFRWFHLSCGIFPGRKKNEIKNRTKNQLWQRGALLSNGLTSEIGSHEKLTRIGESAWRAARLGRFFSSSKLDSGILQIYDGWSPR